VGHVFAIGTTVTLVFTGDYLDEIVPGTPILADGSQALTANWDAGAYEIRALTFESDVTTGTAPFTVASTTVVANLNADQVDGHDFDDVILANGTVPFTAAFDAGPWQIRAETFRSDVVTGTPPFTVASTTLVSNLNAAYLNGATAASWVLADGTNPLTASWDAGAFQIRALTFYSDVATGTAPLTVASTTMVDNLNTDMLDGYEATAFPLLLGLSGGQVLYGGTDAGDDLTLHSTIHATKGYIYFGANSFYDQVNDRLGLGVTPDTNLHILGAFTQCPLSSDPGDPDAGNWGFWCSDGTDSYSAGDVVVKVNVGAVVKTFRLFQYAAH